MSARDKLAEIISDAENCTDEEGSWALPEDVADAVVAAGWRPPMRVIETVEELEALPNNEERAIPQEAVEAACNAFQRPNRMLINTSDGNLKGRLEAAFEAAEPHLRKKWAEEIREGVNPPDTGKAHEWRRGFITGVLRTARFLEGVEE